LGVLEFLDDNDFCKIRAEVKPHTQECLMINEEMRKTMEFILKQQAQFAVNIQRLQEEQLRDRPRLARLEDSFKLLVELAETSDTRMDATDTRLNTLEINMAKLGASMATLAESQAHSDARLSALIDIVREDRNGRSKT
jgi:hypothetical protein